MKIGRRITQLLLLLALAVVPFGASAEGLSSGPIQLVVGFPPGGGTDVLARIISKALAEETGLSVIVQNIGGANGSLAEARVASARPDGHTLFFGTAGNISVNPLLYKLPFSIQHDFVPISKIADATLILVANPEEPVRTVKDVIALAEKEPGGLKFSTSGIGSLLHLGGEELNLEAHILMKHIPFKGSSPSITAVIGGQVPLAVDTVLLTKPFIQSGKLRAIAVLDAKPSPLFPEIPTVSQTLPGFDVTNWFGVLAPAKTPKDVQAYLNEKLVAALNRPDVKKQLLNQGAIASPTTQAEFADYIASQTEKWGKVIKAANIKIED